MDNTERYNEILSSNASVVVVIAGPGTGKTSRLILPKVMKILGDPNIKSSEIILLSFSRMAANDLKIK